MRTQTANVEHVYTPPAVSPLFQALLAVVLGLTLFGLALGGLAAVYGFQHAGRIFPGVSVAGVDLSGLQPSEATLLLAERLTYPQTGRVIFQYGDRIWEAHPIDVGLTLDPQTSAMAAYTLGRQGNPISQMYARFRTWYSGVDLPPLMVYDERQAQDYLSSVAAQIDQPMIESGLALDGIEVVATQGQIGRRMDIDATLNPLGAQLSSMQDGILPVVVEESQPQVVDVTTAAEQARQILSASLVLSVPDAKEGDPGPWVLEPERLVRMLEISRQDTPQGGVYQIGLDQAAFRTFVEALGPAVAQNPQNARFIFNDQTRQLDLIQAAAIGRSLDVEATLQAVMQGLPQGQHEIPLSLQYIEPTVTDNATAADLGITELVSSHTTYFYGSSGSRIHNIETASARFHGVLVAPGETFSMADALGDVSLDNGYAEALIIYGDRTIEGVGGGVCQVSTTLFRTVFFGGFPVAERHSHAYRVYYYELNAANQVDSRFAGLDATVYVPVVDFKFTNDTPNWLLMETYVNAAARTLTWKFYSTSDGRSVDWDSTGLMNEEDPPEPKYVENPDLAKGEIEQVDWGVAGADVTVSRTVSRDGQVYFEDSFTTHYMPWRDIYEYGPGTRIPGSSDQADKPERQ